MTLSRALNAAIIRVSELVMLPGNVVFPSNDIQSAKVCSQLSAKKLIALHLTSPQEREAIRLFWLLLNLFRGIYVGWVGLRRLGFGMVAAAFLFQHRPLLL